MATRPIFIPEFEGPNLVSEKFFDFSWASGFAETQKKKNIKALHSAAKTDGYNRILEISTKSDDKVGRRLSAFSLKYKVGDFWFPLESVYQGSKVFQFSGPFSEAYNLEPRDAKRLIRMKANGNLIRFQLENKQYPTSPKNGFYDWLYIRSLVDHENWIKENITFEAFTDIEFNPSKQINCQARAFAEFVSLRTKGLLQKASTDFEYFASLLRPI